jgi:uncharacterized protein YbjT (DUF2867 family)
VTGATGRIGRRVVDALVAQGVPVRALTRRPAEADLPPAVEVVGGDLTDPASLGPAVDGAGSVLLVWTAPLSTAAEVVGLLAGSVQRVVLLTSPHRTPHPFFSQPNPGAALHAELERLVAGSGMPTTVVRPGMFASNALYWWAPAIRAGEAVRWPYLDVATAPVDERDVADVIATSLLDDAQVGNDHVVTGPESLRQVDQVRLLGEAAGRAVETVELSAEEFRRETQGTWPPLVVDMLLDAWGASVGVPAYVTDAVRQVTGRPARTYAQWAAENAAALRPA